MSSMPLQIIKQLTVIQHADTQLQGRHKLRPDGWAQMSGAESRADQQTGV